MNRTAEHWIARWRNWNWTQRTLRIAPMLGVGMVLSIVLHAWRAPAAAASAPTNTEPPPAAVATAAAVSHQFEPMQWVPGTVISRDDARVASELAGRVVRVAEVGTRVRRGDVLAQLDGEALTLTERENAAALARIVAQLAFAERQLERLSALHGQSSVAATQLDQVRTERDTLRQDRARAEAVLAQTQRQLRATSVRAPFDGVVAERQTQVGEMLAAGAAVVRLVNTDDIEVRAQAPLALAARLRDGASVRVREGAFGAEDAAATIRTVVPVGDASSRQLEVRVRVARADWSVGAAIEVALPQGEARDGVAVPRDALILRGAQAWVYRVNAESKAERVDLELGAAHEDWVEVHGALAVGDTLVVRGGERLSDGQRVRVSEDAIAHVAGEA
jgi:RND family efflux transporter MFP subunit